MNDLCYIQYRFDIPYFSECVRTAEKEVGLVIYDYQTFSQPEKDILNKEANVSLYKNVAETSYKYKKYIIPALSLINQTLLCKVIWDLLKHGKKVECFKKIEDDEELGRMLSQYKNSFSYLPQIFKRNHEISISCPVIYICSDHTESRKTDIQIKLSAEFEKNGATVSNISYDEWTELLGYHKIPRELLDSKIHLNKRDTIFKEFIEHIIFSDSSDVIIINIPGNTVPFDNGIPNTSWLASYFSSLLKPDYAIYSIMSLNNNKLKQQIDYVGRLINKDIDETIMTDHAINTYKYNDESVISVIKMNEDYVVKNYEAMISINELKCPTYLYHSDDWQRQIFNNFFKKFASNRNERFLIIQ